MFKRLLNALRPRHRAPTAEELQTSAEAKQMRDDMETLETGSEGAPTYTHGGKESRRG